MSRGQDRQVLRDRRAANRKQCAQDITRAERVMGSENPDLSQLRVLMKQLQTNLTETSEIDMSIAMTIDDQESIDQEVWEAIDYRDLILDRVSKIKMFINSKHGDLESRLIRETKNKIIWWAGSCKCPLGLLKKCMNQQGTNNKSNFRPPGRVSLK